MTRAALLMIVALAASVGSFAKAQNLSGLQGASRGYPSDLIPCTQGSSGPNTGRTYACSPADILAGGGAALTANNLSDVNPAAARSNLGLAPSATTDTTNASNITSGTIGAQRLPVDGLSILVSGGKISATAASVGADPAGAASAAQSAAQASGAQRTANLTDLSSPPSALSTLKGLPHMASNAALSGLAASTYPVVVRDGFAAAGDAPPLQYTLSFSPCSLNSGSGDGGYQIPTAGGQQCWVAGIPSSGIDLRWYGVQQGQSIDTALKAAAQVASSGVGGGTVVIPPSYYNIAQSANLDLSVYPNVNFVCNGSALGYTTTPLTAPCTLRVNPAYALIVGSRQRCQGLRIQNINANYSNTLRGALNTVQAMSGTGIILNYGSNDVNISDVTVNGFNTAIYTNSSNRVWMQHVNGDDINGLNVSICGDTCQFDSVEFWPFLTVDAPIQTVSISGVTNANGLFGVTLSSAPATPFVTGDIVVIYGTGVASLNNRWAVTAVDATHITLQGSTYASGWSSGGSVYMSPLLRRGTAFIFNGANVGGEKASSMWEYGHDVGMSIGDLHGPTVCMYCWFDGDTENGAFADPVPVGVYYQGYGGGVVGGYVVDKARVAVINSTDSPARPFVFTNMELSATGCLTNPSGYLLDVVQGSAAIVGSSIEGMGACGSALSATYLSDAATSARISGTALNGAATAFQSAADCAKYSVDGVVGPCAFLPVLMGGSTPGSPSYSIQTGEWVSRGNGADTTAWLHLSTTSLGGAAGPLVIGGLPSAAGASLDGGSCAISRVGGITLPSGYTQIAAQVSPTQSAVTLGELSSQGGATQGVAASQVGSPFELQATCHYHQ